MSEPESGIGFGGHRRLVRTDPIWLFLAAIALLAFVSVVTIISSGSSELLAGFIGGAYTCVLGGMAFYVWRHKELRS